MEIERELQSLAKICNEISKELGVSQKTVASALRYTEDKEQAREVIRRDNMGLIEKEESTVEHKIQKIEGYMCSDGKFFIERYNAEKHEDDLRVIRELNTFIVEESSSLGDASVIQAFVDENMEDLHVLLCGVMNRF